MQRRVQGLTGRRWSLSTTPRVLAISSSRRLLVSDSSSTLSNAASSSASSIPPSTAIPSAPAAAAAALRSPLQSRNSIPPREADGSFDWAKAIPSHTGLSEIKRIPAPVAKHGVLCCNLEISGFMPDHLDTVAYFAAYSAHQLDIPTTSSPLLSSECASSIYASSVIHLDTIIKKWWVVKGPFVHAKAKEIFEMKRHRRLVQVFDAHEDLVNEWIEYVNRNLPAGVDMKAEVFQHASPSNLLASLKAQKQAKETATANEEGHLHEDLKSSATSSSSSTLKTFDQKVKARTSELLKLLEKKVSNRKRPSK